MRERKALPCEELRGLSFICDERTHPFENLWLPSPFLDCIPRAPLLGPLRGIVFKTVRERLPQRLPVLRRAGVAFVERNEPDVPLASESVGLLAGQADALAAPMRPDVRNAGGDVGAPLLPHPLSGGAVNVGGGGEPVLRTLAVQPVILGACVSRDAVALVEPAVLLLLELHYTRHV